jgi:hypothetical protein
MKFIKTQANLHRRDEFVRNITFNWGSHALRIQHDFEVGYVTTKLGSQVIALNPITESLKIEFVNRQNNNIVIPKPKEFFDQFGIDISYNCFGYCFADGKFHIENPEPIIKEEYHEVGPNDAEVILFKNFFGFADNGIPLYQYSHAVKVLPNGNVSFKPGMNSLMENIPRNRAIHTYNYNHEIYLKKN